MKKGFTLIELLAVIVILSIIAIIATPIVLNIIEDTKENANKRSIDLYARAVENAIVRYQTKENKKPTSYDDIKDYIEYDGAKVECDTFRIYDDSTFYLNNCKVNNVLVENYSYGKATLAKDILSNYGGESNITALTDFSVVSTGLYKAEDDLGTSYYFRGNVTDNYVQFGKWGEHSYSYLIDTSQGMFHYNTLEECEKSEVHSWFDYDTSCIKYHATKDAPMYWRIVRVNGDGTIRLIYDGVELVENGTSHETSIPGDSNDPYDIHDLIFGNSIYKDSDAKQMLDKWYAENLDENYSTYIADNIFCNDFYIANTSGTTKNYGSYDRLVNNKKPVLTCTNQSDRYTKTDTTNGNGLLKYPVGLITADELFMAGATSTYQDNIFYLLGSNRVYATMTPARYVEYGVYECPECYNEYWYANFHLLAFCEVADSAGVITSARPVINLKADVEFTGSGTIDDPYVIVTE